MKRVIDTSAGCPGGLWTWVHSETGHPVRHSNYSGIKNAVKVFLKSNSYPISSQFEDELQENLCAHGARCEEFTPPTLAQKMSTFGMSLYRAAKQWREPLVDAEELQRRRNICAECSYYGGSTNLLKVACQKCGCSGMKLALASQHCVLNPPKW